MRSFLFIICGFICLYQTSLADQFVFERFTSDDGLSQNVILDIEQDPLGYLWFATYDGLNRFDGYEFRHFRHVPQDPHSLSSNLPNVLSLSHDGNLWVGTTDKGLSYYDPTQEVFENYLVEEKSEELISPVSEIYGDSKNRLWVLDNYAIRIIQRTAVNQIEVKELFVGDYLSDYSDPSNMFVIKELEPGRFVFGQDRRLVIIEEDAFRPSCFSMHSIDSSGVPLYDIRSIFPVENGFLVGNGSGILFFRKNPITNTYSGTRIFEQRVSQIVEMPDGSLWAGGREGLFRFEPNSVAPGGYQLSHTFPRGNNSGQIPRAIIHCLKVDHNGNLWIGTEGYGVFKYSPSRTQFRHYQTTAQAGSIEENHILAIHQDEEKNLWVMNKSNLQLLPSTNGKNYETGFVDYKIFDDYELKNLFALLNYRDRDHSEVWVSQGYPACIDRLLIENDIPVLQTLPFDPIHVVRTFFQETADRVWVGTYYQGLIRVDRINGKWESSIFSPKNSRLSSAIVRSLEMDDEGNLWIGTAKGLSVLPAHEKESDDPAFHNYTFDLEDPSSISYDYILPLLYSSRKVLWIGTLGGGLNRFVKGDSVTEGSFVRYTVHDGLPNNVVNQIVEDDDGNLWIGSNKGLTKFDPIAESFVNFGVKDGVQGMGFSEMGGCKLDDGEILMGGVNGFNAFYPSEVKMDSIVPTTVFTDFEINNERVQTNEVINGDVVLSKAINVQERIVLNHTNNYFSIRFAALHFTDPDSNQYKYMLDGYDKQWVTVDASNRKATYTNLDAGEYIFKVASANPNGMWTSEAKELSITIKPAVWKTWWFKFLVFGCVVLMLMMFAALRHMASLRNQRRLQSEIDKQTLELRKANDNLQSQQTEIKLKNIEISEQNEAILNQQEKLKTYSVGLEKLVDERTAELSHAKSRAEASDRLKSSFIANMSHEIRTPLNSIVGFSDILSKKNVLSADETQNLVEKIKQNSDMLVRLVDDILNISAIESGEVKIRDEAFPIVDALQEVYENHLVEVRKTELELKLDLHVEPKLVIHSDKYRFKQIIENLISNAIKYTESGSIEMGAVLEKGSVVVSVKDSGVGIDPQKQTFIFEQFTKIETDIDKLYRGVGLGLNIVKGLSELLGFDVELESELGKGSTFSVIIPLRQETDVLLSKSDMMENKVSNDTDDLSDYCILVAEDDENNRLVVSLMLKPTGCQVVFAENGREAVEAIQNDQRFDLVLMDIKMPVMDGVEAMTKIREITDEIPIIALTAFAYEEEQKEFLRQGFTAHLTKPIYLNKMIEVILYYGNQAS